MANVMYPVIVGINYNWAIRNSFDEQNPTTQWVEETRRWDNEVVSEFAHRRLLRIRYMDTEGVGAGTADGIVLAENQNLPATPLQWRLIVTTLVDDFIMSSSGVNAYQDVTAGVDVPFSLPISAGQILALAEYDSGTDTYFVTDAYGPFRFIVQVTEDVPPAPTLFKFTNATLALELDKGWSFDGEYIPHFLELNWFFGEDPVTYKSVNKVRVHGLVKGTVNLQVSMSGMQGDVATDYIADYTDPEFLDFPFAPIHVASEFVPATNYVGYQDRGLALLMKFEGRNQNIALPEPSHVLQVLALQSSPQGNGKTAN